MFPVLIPLSSLFLKTFKNIAESKLLSMVRSVSEDNLYDTIEFNEFLQVNNLFF